MNKPIKPEITIPQSFAENGVKTDFDDTLLADGFDNLRPDVLAGDNLNKFIDDTYKGLNYGMAAADALNLINEGETLIVRDGKFTSGAAGGGGLDNKITNCLLEVPQKIKLELADGVLTLKAGSKVIVPNGAGVFEEKVITRDLSHSSGATQGTLKRLIYIHSSLSNIGTINVTNALSGSEMSNDTWQIWYDTTNNVVNKIDATAGQVAYTCGFPLGEVTVVDGVITSIDQVFNGFGYIGSTIWVDKGVKCLIPDGRNEDGTLRNVEITTNKVSTSTVQYPSNWLYLMINTIGNIGLNVVNDFQSYYEVSNKSDIPTLTTNGYSYCYCFEDNIMYRTTGSNDWQKTRECLVSVDIRANSTSPYSITSLNPKLPFRAVDHSELEEVQVVVETYSNGASGYRIWSDGYCEQWGRISITENKAGTVTLLKPYSNAYYNAIVTPLLYNYKEAMHYLGLDSITKTTIAIMNGHGSTVEFFWRTMGYIA